MAKVPSDPAKVAVNAPSFRVRLGAPVVSSALADTARLARIPAPGRRRPPVVWTGRTRPGGDTAAARLLQAVRYSEEGLTGSGAGEAADDVGTTQVLPRIAFDDGAPTVVGPRSPRTEEVPRSGGARHAQGGGGSGAGSGAHGPYDGGRSAEPEGFDQPRQATRQTRWRSS